MYKNFQNNSATRSRGNNYRNSRQTFRRGNRQPKKAYIHPSKFVQAAKPTSEDPYVSLYQFSDFGVSSLIMKNLEEMGFVDPSPIQDKTIPISMTGKDIVGIANTGTGKTGAFAIPVLDKLISDQNSRAIIMAPTRELAQQIEEQCRKIGKGSRLDGALLIGGAPVGPQLRDLRYEPRIVIGTPGRIKDHIERGTLNISKFNIIVLDEVDRMLDMGFIHDITHILSRTNQQRQSMFFSATLDNRVKGIIDNFSNDPAQVSIESKNASQNVEQNIVRLSSNEKKIDKLHDILSAEATKKAIIFDDTQRMVESLSKELERRGFSVDSIHGGKSQPQRDRVFKKFKSNQTTVLVATDVAARGLDVPDITHVINYSLPQSHDDYIHRIGRTGRAGKVGFAFTFFEE